MADSVLRPVSATPIAGGIRTTLPQVVAQSAASEPLPTTPAYTPVSQAASNASALAVDAAAIGNPNIVNQGPLGSAVDVLNVGPYQLSQYQDGTYGLSDPYTGQNSDVKNPYGQGSTTIAGAFSAFNSLFGTNVGDFIDPALPSSLGGPPVVAPYTPVTAAPTTPTTPAATSTTSTPATSSGTASSLVTTTLPSGTSTVSNGGLDPDVLALLSALGTGGGGTGGGTTTVLPSSSSPSLPLESASPVVGATTTATASPTISVWVYVIVLVVAGVGYLLWHHFLAKDQGRGEAEGAAEARRSGGDNVVERDAKGAGAWLHSLI
jgi:hypothetical protein